MSFCFYSYTSYIFFFKEGSLYDKTSHVLIHFESKHEVIWNYNLVLIKEQEVFKVHRYFTHL